MVSKMFYTKRLPQLDAHAVSGILGGQGHIGEEAFAKQSKGDEQ